MPCAAAWVGLPVQAYGLPRLPEVFYACGRLGDEAGCEVWKGGLAGEDWRAAANRRCVQEGRAVSTGKLRPGVVTTLLEPKAQPRSRSWYEVFLD